MVTKNTGSGAWVLVLVDPAMTRNGLITSTRRPMNRVTLASRGPMKVRREAEPLLLATPRLGRGRRVEMDR